MRLLSMCLHLSDLAYIMRGNHTRHIHLGIGRAGYALACRLIQYKKSSMGSTQSDRARTRPLGPAPLPSLPLSFTQYTAITPRLPS
jgi:hypothetical protein